MSLLRENSAGEIIVEDERSFPNELRSSVDGHQAEVH